jgi:hypothetical protein
VYDFVQTGGSGPLGSEFKRLLISGGMASCPQIFTAQNNLRTLRACRDNTSVGVHTTTQELEGLSSGTIPATHSRRVQRHLCNCIPCFRRLIDLESSTGCRRPLLQPDSTRPIYFVHYTADGLIYSRAQRSGRTWVAHHWGSRLNGGRTFPSLEKANEYLTASFEQMFPEHRCNARCQLLPEDE